jgi:protein-disulfide isomerase
LNTQRLTLITAALVVLLLIGVIVYSRMQPAAAPTTAQPTGELVYDGQPRLGDPDAPVALAIFEDFKCPHCRDWDQSILPRLERDFIQTGQAKLYYFSMAFMGPDSTTAAVAAQCAYHQDEAAFWEYKTVIYRAQGPSSQQWATPARLQELAQNVGDLDAAALRQCVDENRHADAVTRDSDTARAIGVSATPTLFVDGQQVAAFDYDAIQAAIAGAQSQ